MYNILLTFATLMHIITVIAVKETCQSKCPLSLFDDLVCAYDLKTHNYTMFSSPCAVSAYKKCYTNDELVETPLKYCIKVQHRRTRKMYGESCPVFCPNHYSPVCGASNIRSYAYRTFVNGCHMDMQNCRGEDDFEYTEVPLEFCPRHLMKNIFKEQIVMSGVNGNFRDDMK